ncbi:pol [Symbiodinium sp. CCMP2456]|nr:pol [Symbiodinium sp. CCMP2456]
MPITGLIGWASLFPGWSLNWTRSWTMDGTELRVESNLRAALDLESNQSAVVPVACVELTDARNTWVAREGSVGIEPSIKGRTLTWLCYVRFSASCEFRAYPKRYRFEIAFIRLIEDEGGVAHSDIVCASCAALRAEKPATMAVGEFSLGYEERLIDPEDEEGDDSWTRLEGSSKELALTRREALRAETGADERSDGRPGEGRGPEQLLRDQMDDHDTWEILNYLRQGDSWDGMQPDCEFWVESCDRCAQLRRTGIPLPTDPKLEQHALGPWMDVHVDFTGPDVESDGYRYVCTYTCKLLRVPILEPCRSLKRGDAVMTCMLRSFTIPAVWRHDLGPEFTNTRFEEMTVLLGIQERTPPAHRPMAVGMGETVHRCMNSLIALLLQDIQKACASEWARLLPLVHYIMMNSPILESGLVGPTGCGSGVVFASLRGTRACSVPGTGSIARGRVGQECVSQV